MIDNLLSAVRCPSRYLGREINSVYKDPAVVKLRIAMVFPDLYEIGMSHLGMQILYLLFNGIEDVYCERAFSPAPDMEAIIKKKNIPWVSHETRTPLKDFDVVAFTLPSELNYITILNILELSKIPLRAEKRGDRDPVILGGGACSLNPEPVAPFFDAIFTGEIEDLYRKILEAFLHWKSGKEKKDTLLRNLKNIPGIYIPAMFNPEYAPDGRIHEIEPLMHGYEKVERQVVADFESSPFPTKLVVPFTSVIHNRLSIEIARGCTQGCRFCHAGTIYRPTREKSVAKILELANSALKQTGYEDLSLLSLSAGDYSQIEPLLLMLVHRCELEKISISLPSLRAGTLSENAMNLIKRIRKTGFTIALEAGTERLRSAINKNITEESIMKMIESAFNLGWKGIKLYFMVGLPTENKEDIDGIVDISKKLSGRARGDITVSLATFIPKPHTPFQWERQIALKEAAEHIEFLKSKIKGRFLKIKWQDPCVSFVEGVLSRGDRRLSKVIERALHNGCKLDSWTEYFDFSKWMQSFAEEGIDPEFYLRERGRNEVLPWEHLDSLVKKEFLWNERMRAATGAPIEDCFTGRCDQCGACDFKKIQPVHADKYNEVPRFRSWIQQETKLRLRLTKAGLMKYLSHLEYIKAIERAVRRARLPVAYTEGFHPVPKTSFSPALAIGVESLAEYADITMSSYVAPKLIEEKLNSELPDGISVVEASELPVRAPSLGSIITEMKYEVILTVSPPDIQVIIDKFIHGSEFIIYLEHKKKPIDAKQFITKLRTENGLIKFGINITASGSISPYLFIKNLFGLDDEAMGSLKITKIDVRFGKGS